MGSGIGENHAIKTATLLTAQAAAMYYRTLYYIYHGEVMDSSDLVVMHDRLRTFDGALLPFDDTHIGSSFLLTTLQGVCKCFPFGPVASIVPPVLEACMDKVQRLGEVIENLCAKRLDLYGKFL